MAVNWKPDGYHSVTPYLVVNSPEQLIDFVKEAFGAEEMFRMPGPDGKIAHAEFTIGDSIVMVGNTGPESEATSTMLYVYVEDTDATYRRAVDAGGTSIEEPADQFYGDRRAGVADAFGNRWFVCTKIEDVSPEEMERRVAQLS
jgi:uncharacterized glyoxalase superfamily protein PhnB